MKVLISVKDYDLSDKDELANTLFDVINEDYAISVPGRSDYYLEPLDYFEEDPAEAADLVLGKDEPEKIRHEAEIWNERIDAIFENALNTLIEKTTKKYKSGIRKWHEASLPIYSLRCAAQAADGDFYAMGDYMVYSGEHPYLKPLLEKEVYDDIIGNPQNYAIIDVYPK